MNNLTQEQHLNRFIDRNIKAFLENSNKQRAFGVSYIQRLCRVGYNQACYTRDEMLKRDIIKYSGESEWEYEFNSPQGKDNE